MPAPPPPPARLPPFAQLLVVNGVMRLRVAPRFGLFRMFFRTLVEIGAAPLELEEALGHCRDGGPSFVRVFRELAERVGVRAGADAAPHDHYRSALYALLADWACHDLEERRRNYAIAIPEFELFARGHAPRIERVVVPYRGVGLRAYYVAPERPAAAGLPLPGHDEPEERREPTAEAACA